LKFFNEIFTVNVVFEEEKKKLKKKKFESQGIRVGTHDRLG
jgi:hypothetical protein